MSGLQHLNGHPSLELCQSRHLKNVFCCLLPFKFNLCDKIQVCRGLEHVIESVCMGFTIRVIQHVQIACFENPLSHSGNELDTWVGQRCAWVSFPLAPFRFTSTKDIALKSVFPFHCQDLSFVCVLVYITTKKKKKMQFMD